MVKKTAAVTPPATVECLLAAAGGELVLVGGQALALWVNWYQLALLPDVASITNDVDFLTPSAADKHAVERFAQVLHGRALFPRLRELTALVGQAYVDVSDDEYINVDVIFSVVGIEGDSVRSRAVTVDPGSDRQPFKVMHPLDVLRSRLANLYGLPEKQDRKGQTQLALAIDVAREFLREAMASHHGDRTAKRAVASGRSPIQAYVSAIERMVIEDAGRKVTKRYGLHVADAIDPLLIPAGPFWDKRWPGLMALMSPTYAARFEAAAAERQSRHGAATRRRPR